MLVPADYEIQTLTLPSQTSSWFLALYYARNRDQCHTTILVHRVVVQSDDALVEQIALSYWVRNKVEPSWLGSPLRLHIAPLAMAPRNWPANDNL